MENLLKLLKPHLDLPMARPHSFMIWLAYHAEPQAVSESIYLSSLCRVDLR